MATMPGPHQEGDRMPLELLLIVLVVIALVVALLPAGRRVVLTFVDVVDASVAMYTVRDVLGLDTTTARQRRIDRRHAREQADIERRIGARAELAMVPKAPTRLVLSGERAVAPTPARAPSPRRTLAIDTTVTAVGLVLVVVAIGALARPPNGAVLGATGAPAAGPASAPPSTPAPTAAPSADPSPSITP
jgi:hypothetical protein